ncbi:hypothetical protein [Staphylothermus hellenicus]|uniref:Uncharacterized protein n=1 Tax=Staphylothermus hellenicus (strain DSM 12710 / JCM 10830 / BK20S6-10-b1 / P8) TaxID=591019 RepID=D7DB75_STAHD|nr:hypothetical protein [Staphylothermus hellenicus]ADI31422.1 hypothetical protein Shell_0284 [Staphylothermus hellenicus DSM 12710]
MMPKTPSVILREELAKRQLELLDIYHGKEKDIIRVKDKMSGKVFLYETKTFVRDMDKDRITELANNIQEKLKELVSKK